MRLTFQIWHRYDLSIADAGGCPITKTYTITEPNDIIIGTDLQKNITCFNKADGSDCNRSQRYLELFLCLDEKRKPYSTSEDLSNLARNIYCLVSDAKIAV
jgi:hypothetical protein